MSLLLLLSGDQGVDDNVGITDAVAVTLTRVVTDAVALADVPQESGGGGLAPFTSDPITLADAHVLSSTKAVVEAFGLADDASESSLRTAVRTPTETVGIADAVITAKTIPAPAVVDSVGLTDVPVPVESFALPSIDGAISVVGIPVLETQFDPSANPIEVGLPSIDGATAPKSLTLLTATQLTNLATESEVYAELWSADGSTRKSELLDQVSVEWQDVENETGIGVLTLNRHDPDASLVAVGDQIYCYLYGQRRFIFLVVEPPDLSPFYDPENESAETVTVTGPGRNHLADQALVYLPKGLSDPLNAPHRLYSFASIDYVPGVAWQPAVQQYRADELDPIRFQIVEWTYVGDDVPDVVENVPTPAPLGWPDAQAYWIWGNVDRTLLGLNFFRKTFSLTEEKTVVFAATADNYYTLYLDGTPIIGENAEFAGWQEFKSVEIKLPIGTYTLAAVVENIPLGFAAPAAFNPAGFICSVYEADAQTGEPLTVFARSDSTWTSLDYPATWPGFTPGGIILDMIAEAQARGEIPDLTVDFTATTDSAGDPWPVTQGFSHPIGQSILEALNSLVEAGWLTYKLSPGGLTLQCYNYGYSPDSGVTFAVTGDEATTNLAGLSFSPQSAPRNRLLVKWSQGYFQLDDAGSQATYGIRPEYITLDAATQDEARRRAQVILDNVKEPREAIVADLDPIGGDRPYEQFRVGERVTLPSRSGGNSLEKVVAMSISVDPETRKAVIGVELNTRIEEVERKEEELLRNLGSGVTRGDKVRWQIYQTEAIVR